jgi:hypothetical protein
MNLTRTLPVQLLAFLLAVNLLLCVSEPCDLAK